jgi:AraC-like DNA-binding protein
MSPSRQVIHPDNLIHPDLSQGTVDDLHGPVVGWAGEQEKGVEYELHGHWRAQLFHIVSGSVTVETEQGSFVVPPERALWIPSNVLHGVRYHQRTVLSYLFFRPEAVRHLTPHPSVIRLSPLVRELIATLLGYPRGEAETAGPAGRVAGVILDQLATEPLAPLHLPMPSSTRLRRAVDDLAADPARGDGLADVARRAALSERSFERHFRSETGLSFRAWRRQARLMKAVEWLSLGAPVGEVAYRLGYEEPSAFVAGFRKAFGVTPGRYFADADA